MMAIFGWLMLCVILGFISASALIVVANYGGKWTVGGAENSVGTRISALVAIIVLVAAWMIVFANKPFVIVGV